MTKRLASWWIPAAAFGISILIAIFAGTSGGAFSLRMQQGATGKKYKCTRCNPQTGILETQYSDTKIDGWECTDKYPVNYSTGANFYSNRDLGTGGLTGLSVTRAYLSDPTLADGGLGTAWRLADFLRAVKAGSRVEIVSGTASVVSFVDNGDGTYTPEFDYVQTLVSDALNHLLILTDAKGKQWKFFDFTASWSAALQGRLQQFIDRAGNVTSLTYSATPGPTLDKVLEVQQTDPNPALVNKLTFTYNLSGASTGLTASIALSRIVSGTPTTVRVANYTYYTSSGPNGPAGSLERVVITDGVNSLDTHYYRYNAADAGGWVPVRFAVHPTSYERLKTAAGGTDAGVDAASDTTVAVYADLSFEYDAQRRVTKETVQGQGCGCGSAGGKGVFMMSYTDATHGLADSSNVWSRKTVETLPDGNQDIVYTNGFGQTMLQIYKDTASGQEWKTYFQYDASSRLLLRAEPSVQVTYSEASPGLVTSIPASQGLIKTYEYYAATDLPNGAVAGYVSAYKCRQGNSGTPILLKTTKFTSRTGVSGTIYPLLSETAYRNTDGTGGMTFSFGYTWQGTSNEVLQKTTTHPIVTAAQNGSNAATSHVIQMDAFGRLTWKKDADGFIHATEYDTLNGAVTRRIGDVNTTLVANEPAGWVTPAGGGLNLVTDFEVDVLGRTTRLTDPNGNLHYTVYRDPQHETRFYPGWNTATNLPTGPTQLHRDDHENSYTERLTFSAAPAVSGGRPTGTEAISGIQSLVRDYLDTGDRVTYSDSYVDLTGVTYSTAPNIGTLGTNFYRTLYNYDAKGRQDRVEDWTGTISRNVFDSRDRLISQWVGTDDTPTSGDWSPANTVGTNLNKLVANEYDSNGVGDGNLTRTKAFTSSVTSLDTVYQFDFRNRQVDVRGPDNVASKRTLDNLGRATVVETYADATLDFVIGAGELRGKEETKFDEKGQVYQTIQHNVDPATGAVGNRLTSNHWHNARGHGVKSKGPNGELQKTQYDGAGRSKATFNSFDAAESTYAQALDVASDTVISETVTFYDAASNVIQTTRYDRTSTTAKLGDLSVSWAAGQSRRTFTAEWFDRSNRRTDFVNYGDNGGANLTRPATAPAPNTSDNYLVSHFDYDAGGRAHRTTDNLNRIVEKSFDLLGRATKMIENRVDGVVSETELDTDRTTSYIFDSSGRMSQKIAHNPKGSGAGVEQQVTRLVYGTVANQATPAIYRNDLLVAVIEADSDDTYNPAAPAGSQLGNGADATYDRLENTFDYSGRTLTRQDQRGVVRTLAYDSAGRFSADTVTTLPPGVDGLVRRIGVGYDSLSREELATSYSDTGGTIVVNQVKRSYDGWANETKREEAHTGLVGGGTPFTLEVFADGAVSGEAKYNRRASTTYANGRTVYSNYPAAGSIGDRLSRVDNLANDASATTIFAQYTYLGINIFGRIDHPLVTTGLRREVGTGGNPAEWDRFGRVSSERWKRSGAVFNYDRYEYTYNRVSNPLSRNVTPNSPPTGRDEFYVYDGLERLTKTNRGNLSGGQITDANANFRHQWSELESFGNWRSWIEDTNGGGAGGSTTQTRTHNKANEIAVISGNTPDWVDPQHDLAGNMKNGPQPGAESARLHFTFDAWNRLVQVQADSGGSAGATLAEYQYDARSRRIVKLLPNGSNWDRRDYYYNRNWQCLEERELLNTPSKTTVATVPKFQWIWDLRYPDAVVLRDENKDGDGDCVDGTDQRLFYTQDARYNTTALVDTAGNIVERYVYDSYGKPSVLTGTWTAQSATLFRNEVLFAGYRQDPETGLYHVRHRSYHSTLGRWLQRDPIGDANGPNLYQYVGSGPTYRVDPSGLFQWTPEVTVRYTSSFFSVDDKKILTETHRVAWFKWDVDFECKGLDVVDVTVLMHKETYPGFKGITGLGSKPVFAEPGFNKEGESKTCKYGTGQLVQIGFTVTKSEKFDLDLPLGDFALPLTVNPTEEDSVKWTFIARICCCCIDPNPEPPPSGPAFVAATGPFLVEKKQGPQEQPAKNNYKIEPHLRLHGCKK